jgi:hypothetical protein
MICCFCAAEGLDELKNDNQVQKTPSNGDFLRNLSGTQLYGECAYNIPCTVDYNESGCPDNEICCCVNYQLCGPAGYSGNYACVVK